MPGDFGRRSYRSRRRTNNAILHGNAGRLQRQRAGHSLAQSFSGMRYGGAAVAAANCAAVSQERTYARHVDWYSGQRQRSCGVPAGTVLALSTARPQSDPKSVSKAVVPPTQLAHRAVDDAVATSAVSADGRSEVCADSV